MMTNQTVVTGKNGPHPGLFAAQPQGDAELPTVNGGDPPDQGKPETPDYSVGTFIWGVDGNGNKFEGVVRKPGDGRVQITGDVTVMHGHIIGSIDPSPELSAAFKILVSQEEKWKKQMAAAKRRNPNKKR